MRRSRKRGRSGLDAVACANTKNTDASYRIARNPSTPRELGQALAAFMPDSSDRDAFLRSCGDAPPKRVGPAVSAPSSTFSPGVLERAGRELAGYLGPMARILVSRTSAMAHSEEELYDLLAAEIGSPKDREAFRRKGPSARRRP